MPARDKASHMRPGLPLWACKGVPYMCPHYPRPGCGTQLPRPVEQTWRLGNRRQVLSSREGSGFLQGHILPTPRPPDNHCLPLWTWGPVSVAAQPNSPCDPKSCPILSLLGQMDVSAKPSLAC